MIALACQPIHDPAAMRVRRTRLAERTCTALITILIHLPLAYFFVARPGIPAAPAQDDRQEKQQHVLEVFFLTRLAASSDQGLRPAIRPRLVVPRVQAPALAFDIQVPVESPATAAPPQGPEPSPTEEAGLIAMKDVPQPATRPSENGGPEQAQGEGGIAESRGGMSVVRSVPPNYPWGSFRRHEQGTAVVGVKIDDRGRVTRVRLLHSSGFQRLDAAALHAVLLWQFSAPPAGEQPGHEEIALQIGFHLSAAMVRVPTVVLPFDAGLVARINATARSGERHEPPTLANENAVRRMAEALRMANNPAAGVGHAIAPRRELTDRGPVRSVKLLGTVRRSANVDFVQSERDRGVATASNSNLLWYAFEVRQEHGTSEWLLGTTVNGAISTVEVIAGAPACAPEPLAPACVRER